MSGHEHHGTNVADEISVNPLFAREGEELINKQFDSLL